MTTECDRFTPRRAGEDTRVHLGLPRPAEPVAFDPAKVTQGFIADYKSFTTVDGQGVRCALYVSGCLMACPGCFNEAAWSFRYGSRYDQGLEDRIMADLAKPYVQGLSLLGGEPMMNTDLCLSLVRRMRAELPGKDVWCWSGMTFEYLTSLGHPNQRELLDQIDVLVDGPFLAGQKDLSLAFRGSKNQRVLDVPASLAAGHAVPWAGLGQGAA